MRSRYFLFECTDALGGGVNLLGGDDAVLHKLLDGFDGVRHHVGVIAAPVVGKAEKVASGHDGKAQGLLEAIVGSDGTHGKVVGNNNTVETKLVAEQLGHDGWREGGGEFVAEVAVDDVSHHYHVDESFVNKCAIGFEFYLFPCFGDVDKAGMGVASGAAVAGEVFEATDDVLSVQFVEPEGGAAGHGGGVGGEAASQFAYDGARGVDIDVHAWGEVEVDASLGEFPGYDGGIAGDTVVAPMGGGLGCHGTGEAVAGA